MPDRLLHRQMHISGRLAHKAEQTLVDQFLEIDIGFAVDLAPEPHLRIFGRSGNTGLARFQRVRTLFQGIADTGNNTHPGNDDTAQMMTHYNAFGLSNSPTFRSAAS